MLLIKPETKNHVLKKFIAILLLSGLPLLSIAQELSGFSVSDYSGIQRGYLNPASIINSRKYVDVMFADAGLFFQNNYLYIPSQDYSPRRLVNFDFPTYPETGGPFLDDYVPGNKAAFIQSRTGGPSAMLIAGNQAFSVTSSFRTITSIHRLPVDIAKFTIEGINFEPQQNIRYTHDQLMKTASVSFAEISFGYANTFYRQADERIAAGLSISRLLPYHGLYVETDFTDYMTPQSDTLIFYGVNGTGGFTVPVDYNDNSFLGLADPVRGRGFSMSAGIVYTRLIASTSARAYRNLCAFPFDDYIFRIGLSILDLGRLNYDRGVESLVFDNIDTTWVGIGSVEFTSLNQFLGVLNNELGGGPNSLSGPEEFRVSLPTTVSLQYDYNFRNNFYLNTVWLQYLPVLNSQIHRPSFLSVIPRYATSFYELAMPLNLYDYKQPMIGLSFRVLYLSVGTGNLPGLLGWGRDFDGLDFYASLQFGILKGNCGRRFGGLRDCHRF
jgi:hypothetical protein